jgi:hypothetical protein
MPAWLSKNKLALLFVIALLARVAFVLTLENRYYYFDTVHYDKAAKALIAGQGFGEGYEFSQFFRKEYALTPLYPLFLAAIYFVFGANFLAVRLVESLLGAFLCLLIYKIGKRVFNETAGLWAGYLSAVFPHLIFLCGLLYVENLFTLLLALGIWYCLRWQDERRHAHIISASLMFGLACLGRPVVFAFYPFLALWLMFINRGEWRSKIAATALCAGVTVCTLAPWTIRNYLIFGKITPVSAAAEKYLGESEELLDQKIAEAIPVAGDELKIVTTSDSTGHHFDFYHNGEFDGRLSDSLKTYGNGEELYAGIMLRGNLPNEVDEFSIFAEPHDSNDHHLAATAHARAGNGTSVPVFHDDFERERLGPAWQAPAEFHIKTGALQNAAQDDSWKHLVICREVMYVRRVALRWGRQAQAGGVKEGGLALRLDRPASDANGYLAWRQPAGQLLLFTIENGAPGRQVAMAMGRTGIKMRAKLQASINAEAVKNQSFTDNLLALILKDPKAFGARYVGEFIHFWKPMPDRFYSRNEFTVSWTGWVSALAFAPILLLSVVGLFFIKQRWRETSLILFMILSTALIYSFFMTKARYRMPVEPYMIIIAANAVYVLMQKFRKAWIR